MKWLIDLNYVPRSCQFRGVSPGIRSLRFPSWPQQDSERYLNRHEDGKTDAILLKKNRLILILAYLTVHPRSTDPQEEFPDVLLDAATTPRSLSHFRTQS